MLLIKSLVVVVALFIMNTTYAVQYKFVATDDSISTKICVLAGNDNKSMLRKTLKDTSRNNTGNFGRLVNKIHCNDILLANFAHKYDAKTAFNFLKRYTLEKNLAPDTRVIIKDVAFKAPVKQSEEKIILVYVGH